MSDMDMMAPTEACRPFQDCLMTATMGTVNDQQITTAARNIYNQKEKCKADFGYI